MIKITNAVLGMLLCSFSLLANEPKIVKLTPPQITNETLSEKIVCTRPMREGKFNISMEQISGKTIVNCYGMGGSGWTTLFGSVNKAIELYTKTNPDKTIPIRIIGSGCMGLTAAIELNRLGYNVVGISTKSLYDMPSWRAAGYFALVSVKTSPEEQASLNEIGLNTFLTYQQIDKGSHPYITKDAVRFMPVYCSEDTDSGVEDLEVRGLIPPREYVTIDFGGGVLQQGFVKFMTYFMDTTSLMRQLTAQVNKLGINVVINEVKAFDDVGESVVFNCSGLGGRELNDDENMIPVRGHLITLNAASGSGHMDYMVYTKVKQDGQERYVYMFPKSISVTPETPQGSPCMGVLGGTFIPHVDKMSAADQAQLDKKEFNDMLDRNCEFFLGRKYNE
jgi:hypothetical protein